MRFTNSKYSTLLCLPKQQNRAISGLPWRPDLIHTKKGGNGTKGQGTTWQGHQGCAMAMCACARAMAMAMSVWWWCASARLVLVCSSYEVCTSTEPLPPDHDQTAQWRQNTRQNTVQYSTVSVWVGVGALAWSFLVRGSRGPGSGRLRYISVSTKCLGLIL